MLNVTGPFLCGSDALDLVETLDRTSTVDDAVDALRGALARFGSEFFCVASMPRPDQRFEEVMHAIRIPSEWIGLYLQEQYAQVDPGLRHCKRTSFPFERKSARFDPDAEPRAAEMVKRATDFGLWEGLWIPIHGSMGCEGVVWVGGDHLDLTQRSKVSLHLIAIYAFDRVRRLSSIHQAPKPALTTREREVLTWVAQGKSAWEISEILSIAKRTVDEHAQTAFRKLNAVNRAQAVAIALRERIIEP